MNEELSGEHVESEKEQRYPYGRTVSVMRTNGRIEDGWSCVGHNSEGLVRLIKAETDEVKFVSEDNLDEFNMDKSTPISFRAVVRVARTSGEIEDNWTVTKIEEAQNADALVTVEKPIVIDGQNKIQRKVIPLSKLEEIN